MDLGQYDFFGDLGDFCDSLERLAEEVSAMLEMLGDRGVEITTAGGAQSEVLPASVIHEEISGWASECDTASLEQRSQAMVNLQLIKEELQRMGVKAPGSSGISKPLIAAAAAGVVAVVLWRLL